jgi:hypothetical protein
VGSTEPVIEKGSGWVDRFDRQTFQPDKSSFHPEDRRCGQREV